MSTNILSSKNVAPLTNVALCMSAVKDAQDRPMGLPGMVAFYGPSGFGKTVAAGFCATHFDAYYIQCKSVWTKKNFLDHLAREMNLKTGTMSVVVDRIIDQLLRSRRPLIIDEFDHMVAKKQVELIRDIFNDAKCAIVLIGEERLEQNLMRWERFHNRMLKWVPAQPASMTDTLALAEMYCPDIQVGEDMLQRIINDSRGCTRRISTNIHDVYMFCVNEGLDAISLKEWGDRPFYTGKAPSRRV